MFLGGGNGGGAIDGFPRVSGDVPNCTSVERNGAMFSPRKHSEG